MVNVYIAPRYGASPAHLLQSLRKSRILAVYFPVAYTYKLPMRAIGWDDEMPEQLADQLRKELPESLWHVRSTQQ